MYSIARLNQIEEERAAKKLEREKRKKEKEREKRRKKSRSKSNRKYYAKQRKKELAHRQSMGDENAYFLILLTKNRQRLERIGASKWKSDAYKIFNEAIEKNREEVKFPIQVTVNRARERNPILYEIVMIKNTTEGESDVSQLRNQNGKYVDNIILDKKNHVIVDKREWLIEETFYVYGYHPIRGRKTYDFILNEILLKNIESKYDIRTIFTFKNKVFIKRLEDFDFVSCKSASEAQRLAMQLEKDIPRTLKKNIFNIGQIKKSLIPQLVQDMIEKTGWSRAMCTRVV